MPIPSTMADLSTTAASNSPAGSDSPADGDNFLRAIQAIIRTTNAQGADIASATTTDIGAATGEFVTVTGTTTITGLGTIAAGISRVVHFSGALTLTHNASSLILPGSSNITTAAGDVAMFRSLGSGNWRCVNYLAANGFVTPASTTTLTNKTVNLANNTLTGTKAEFDAACSDGNICFDGDAVTNLTMSTDRLIGRTTASTGSVEEITVGSGLTLSGGSLTATGASITLGTPQASTSGTSIDFTSIPSGTKRITITFDNVSTNGTSQYLIQIGDSGGVETTGYKSGSFHFAGATGGAATSTAGFNCGMTGTLAVNTHHGSVVLTRYNTSHAWTCHGSLAFQDGNTGCSSNGGAKTLSAELDRVRITTIGGTDTFDSGTLNIVYE